MRYRVSLSVLLLALLVSAFSYGETLRVSAERASLRSGPTLQSAIVVNLTKGELLGVLAKQGYWNKVEVLSTGEVGYIHSALVSVYQGATGAPSTTASAPAPPPSEPPPPARPPSRQPLRSQSTRQVTESQGRSYRLTAAGGFIDYMGGSDLGVSGAVGFKPFANPAMEVEVSGDVWFSPIRTTAFMGSFLYNFDISHPTFMPYAGVGMLHSRASGFSDTDIQVGGGLRILRSDGRDFRIDLRFADGVARVLFGLDF